MRGRTRIWSPFLWVVAVASASPWFKYWFVSMSGLEQYQQDFLVGAALLFLAGMTGLFWPPLRHWLERVCRAYRAKRPMSSIVVVGLMGAAAGAILSIALFLVLSRDQSDQPLSSSADSFSVEVRTACVSDSGPLTYYMVGYPSLLGQTVSPVFYLAYIQIANLQEIISTISEYRIAASKDPGGPWDDLAPIPLDSTTLYSLGGQPTTPKTVKFGHGTYRFGGERPVNEMNQALILRAEPTLDSELTEPIQPHHTINGWVALDSLKHSGLPSGGTTYFRISLRDSANKRGEYIAPLPIRNQGQVLSDINTGSIFVTGQLANISGLKVKYYAAKF